MPTFQADPSNLSVLLQMVRDGDVLNLASGDYRGCYCLDKSLTLRGAGSDTVIFGTNEPAVRVEAANVRLENLAVERTVRSEAGAVALFAEPGTLPILRQVQVIGIAENVQWEGETWDIPAVLEFGEVETNRQVERCWQVQIGSPCEIVSDLNWLFIPSAYLSPGLQEIKIGLNSRNLPAGTILAGSIILKAADGNRAIDVTATIKASHLSDNVESLATLSEATFVENIPTQDWGYRLVGKISDRIIQLLDTPGSLNNYKEYQQRRDRAEQLIYQLAGNHPQLFYARRLGQGENPDEEKWELIIATDNPNHPLPETLSQQSKTIRFISVVRGSGYDGLKLLSAGLVPFAKGYRDDFAVPYRLRLVPNYSTRRGVPREAIQCLAAMPFSGDYFPTEQQSSAWQTFVAIERRLAESRQFCVAFVGHNYGAATRKITFELDVTSATVDGSSENALNQNDLWQRVARARNEEIKLFETTPDADRRNGKTLGYIEAIDPQQRLIRIKLEADFVDRLAEGNYQLPKKGFLLFAAAGDIIQIKRKERGLQDLAEGRTQNRYLGEFFFDASQARKPKTQIKLSPEELLLPSANADQIAAVEAVLSAPDLVLIQGPPGTGKTTVIAEICYQVARRGGRTLIASQANLAVDNALSRLIHNPLIRALRKGKPSRVEEEGLPFLEDNVIGTWLQHTAADCEKDLTQRQNNVRLYQQFLEALNPFTFYLETEEGFESKKGKLHNRKQSLEQDLPTADESYKTTKVQQDELELIRDGLNNVLASKLSVNLEDANFLKLLGTTARYLETSDSVDYFKQVRYAVAKATELGGVAPQYKAFGLAGWLQETVINWIEQVKATFPYLNEITEAMKQAEAYANLHSQKLEHFEDLRRQLQQVSGYAHSRDRIIKLRRDRLEIKRAIHQLQEWSSTANINLYSILSKSLQNGNNLTHNLFLLPSILEEVASLLELTHRPWVPYWANRINEINDIFLKYREWHISSNRLKRISSKLSQLPPEVAKEIKAQKLVHPLVMKKSIKDFIAETKHFQSNNRLIILELELNELVDSILKVCLSGQSRLLLNLDKVSNYAVSRLQINQQICNIVSQEIVPFPVTQGKLIEIANTTVDTIAKLAERHLSEREDKIDQKLHKLETELEIFETTTQKFKEQISTVKFQLKTNRENANLQFHRSVSGLKNIVQRPDLPGNLRILAQDYLNTPQKIISQSSDFYNQVYAYQSNVSQLERLIAPLDPWKRLEKIYKFICDRISILQPTLETALAQRNLAQAQLSQVEEELQQLQSNLNLQRNWWQKTWEGMRGYVKFDVPSQGLFSLNFLHKIKTQFAAWQQELSTETAYLNRYSNLITDWINKLRHPSEQDLNELKRIYMDSANVIGITCGQASGYSFVKEFNNFDVVIIDEVSKCTPPELLIPALKGKKLVLIGDYRQLPPMLNDSTVEEIAEDMGVLPEDLTFLDESLFKIQFEAADESIKRRLTIQYRMHPIIMGGINQFYEHRLQCGILDPDRERAHHLSGEVIQDNHHLLWVQMPQQPGFEEQQEGTSYTNPKEVDAIERICQQLDRAWSDKLASGEDKKEVGIITFYGAQLRLIEERIENNRFPSLKIRTGTVDRFQGMERPVIIVSMVRNNNRGIVGFAKKPERVNVAFSRAQELLIIVGCHSLFTQHRGEVGQMYSEVSNFVRRNGGLIDVSHILS